MNKKTNKRIGCALSFLAAFVLWTCAVCFYDVQTAGLGGTRIGFASLNLAFHRLTGVHMALYEWTDVLSLIPLGFVCAFGLLGLCQVVKRKSIARVDRSLLCLGAFYLAVAASFLLFEFCIVNYRPILIEGKMEASYPSSTTLLVLTVMPSAMMQLGERMKKSLGKTLLLVALGAFTAFMLLARLLSGVHWVTDIVGGVLLSMGLVCAYQALAGEK